MNRPASLFFTLIIICAFQTLALGQQSATATLAGVVTDPRGDVIEGARVTATNNATGIKRESTTNGEGLFTITNLPPGEYEIKAYYTGFEAMVYPRFSLHGRAVTTTGGVFGSGGARALQFAVRVAF